MDAADPIIESRGLGRIYGARWAVHDIDLVLRTREIIGVVGPDGSGKSTLLQMCAGILDPSRGWCRVMGLDTAHESKAVAARIGYMSQGFTLYDRLTVEENLRFSADIRGVTEPAYRLRRAELMVMAGLERFSDWPAGRLSGGMRKKLSLCTNLIHQPRLLILDEPGLGVDPLSRMQLWRMLEQFVERGASILVATSYMDEAERCGSIMLLHQGEALVFDTPKAVRARAAGRVFEAPSVDPSAAASALTELGGYFAIQTLPDRVRFLTVEERQPVALRERTVAAIGPIQPAEPSLEDVFVAGAGPESDAEAERPEMPEMPEMPEPVAHGGIQVEDVTVRFGEFTAVSAVTLSARPGEAVALLGPNGAGKTTLIRAFCGLVPITSGEARIADRPVHAGAHETRQDVGYMSQRFSLYPDLSVRENLMFSASAYGLRRRVAKAAIGEACAMTGIEATDALVSELSAATRQRLALASSILHRPAVLFLDEPTSGVDPISRYRFWRLIRSLCRAGMTVIVSTHYLDEAEYCDRIALMHRGRLIAHGGLSELRSRFSIARDATVKDLFSAAIAREAKAEPTDLGSSP